VFKIENLLKLSNLFTEYGHYFIGAGTIYFLISYLFNQIDEYKTVENTWEQTKEHKAKNYFH